MTVDRPLQRSLPVLGETGATSPAGTGPANPTSPALPEAHPSAVRIVKTGTWCHGRADRPVDIIALEYDWWYAMAAADHQLAPGERPVPPDPEGYLYYARFTEAGRTDAPGSIDSIGHASLAAAMRYAQSKVAGAIRWS